RLGPSFVEYNGHDGQFPAEALVNQMTTERIPVPLDSLLARAVKVKLDEPKLRAVNGHEASLVVVDHDRVAVVDHPKAALLVAEFDRMTRHLVRIGDVDGRLAASGTSREFVRPLSRPSATLAALGHSRGPRPLSRPSATLVAQWRPRSPSAPSRPRRRASRNRC